MAKRGYKKKGSKATSKGSLRNSARKKAIAVSANLAAQRESDTQISENSRLKMTRHKSTMEPIFQ